MHQRFKDWHLITSIAIRVIKRQNSSLSNSSRTVPNTLQYLEDFKCFRIHKLHSKTNFKFSSHCILKCNSWLLTIWVLCSSIYYPPFFYQVRLTSKNATFKEIIKWFGIKKTRKINHSFGMSLVY